MFVTFEGMEGSGKSTALRGVAQALAARGRAVVETQEPGGCPLGRTLRAVLLDARTQNLAERAELYLFLADRAQHVHEVVRPALQAGSVVLCDRFCDSTFAYQGHGRGLDLSMLRQLNAQATGGLMPDVTLLFDLPVEEGLARARSRNATDGKSENEGRFEAEKLAFHQRVREGFLELAAAEPDRFRIIDASRRPDQVLAAVLVALNIQSV